MIITIQDADKHSEMLSELKLMTGKNDSSEALLEAGYSAIKLQKLYEEEVKKSKELEEKITSYLSYRLS